MRTWTLVTDALAPGGRREAASLAARGKDLILLGGSRALLDEVAAELRVVHGVDVRILTVDLSDAAAAASVVAWIDDRELIVDGVVTVRWEDADAVRSAQATRQLELLERSLRSSTRHLAFAGVRRVSDSIPPTGRARRSVVPPAELERRPRTGTAPGHRDPSMPPDA